MSLMVVAAAPALATSFTVGPSATLTAAQTLGSASGQTGSIAATGTLSVSGSANAVSITGNNATVTNLGTAKQTGTGRVIRDNTGVTNLIVNNGSTTNSTALMQAADGDVIQMNKSPASVTLNNYGTMTSLNASAGGSQAVDFAAILSGSNVINNFSTGIMQAAEADAVRTGVNGVVNNAGIVKSTTAAGSSSDGIDAQDNSGANITNSATGLVEGGRHGITGGAANAAVSFVMSIVNDLGGMIKGDNGAGVNIDGFNANELVTVNNAGTIVGNGVAGDGDGVDVDGLVNITNTGTIRSANAFNPVASGLAYSEGISAGGGTITNSGTIEGLIDAGNTNAVGRGITIVGNDITSGPLAGTREAIYGNTTITNQSGGLIRGQNESAIAVGGPASGFSVAINNNAGATIRGGGTATAAIVTGADNDAITNAGTIDAASSGKAVDLGAGNDSLNLQTGSSITGGVEGGSGNDTINLSGTGSLGSASNFETLNVQGGKWTLTGSQSYGSGTVSNNGVLDLDPTTITFTDLTVDTTGALQGGAGDVFQIRGDLLNHSTQNTVWNTTGAMLDFVGAANTAHNLLLTGLDYGVGAAGLANNFFWSALELDANNTLSLGNGLGAGAVAFYVGSLMGFDIIGDAVQNVVGNGFNIYYDALLNTNLGGRSYDLVNGGNLIAYNNPVPTPGSLPLLVLGLAALGLRSRKRGPMTDGSRPSVWL